LVGVPFKRLLLAGVGGGLTYTLFNLALPGWSIPVAIVATLGLVLLTALRGGIPLWRRLIYRLRGSMLLSAARYPRSAIGRLTEALELPVELARLDGARVFAPPSANLDIDLREWITFAHAREADGLVFVDAPMQEGLHE
jgi:ABC-type phosphate transport system auxiliary subunit